MDKKQIRIPPPLKSGSVIGIIAPAGMISKRDNFAKGVRILHEMGFQTKFPRQLWPGYGYLADSDHNRAKEFLEMWHDSSIDGIIAARGGFGSLRIADTIAENDLVRSPKRLIGFSDITLLHSEINTQHNMVSFHGPVVTSLTATSREGLQSLLYCLQDTLANWQWQGNCEILQGSGTVSGLTTGGNLATIISSLGTQFEPQWKGKIVFLEDTGEPLYRIDRMLTQLQLCGKFEGVSAIILGDFSAGLGLDSMAKIRHHESIWNRLIELVAKKIPIWANFPIGHGAENTTIPFGLSITLDSSTGRLYST